MILLDTSNIPIGTESVIETYTVLNLTGNELITIIIAVFAVILSIYSILVTNANHKRELRVGKIEEILEILALLNNIYKFYYFNYKKAKSVVSSRSNEERNFIELITLYKKDLENVKKNYPFEMVEEKILRLDVLSNCYLTEKNLKLKIYHMIMIVTHIVYDVYYPEGDDFDTYMEGGYIEDTIFSKYYCKTEGELIKQMKLDTSAPSEEEKEDYKTNFINQLNAFKNHTN